MGYLSSIGICTSFLPVGTCRALQYVFPKITEAEQPVGATFKVVCLLGKRQTLMLEIVCTTNDFPAPGFPCTKMQMQFGTSNKRISLKVR